jgi:hypothetical protein
LLPSKHELQDARVPLSPRGVNIILNDTVLLGLRRHHALSIRIFHFIPTRDNARSVGTARHQAKSGFNPGLWQFVAHCERCYLVQPIVAVRGGPILLGSVICIRDSCLLHRYV